MNTIPSPLPSYRVGIVGGGLAALVAYIVLRFSGLPRQDIAVFSPDDSPEKSWLRLARAINLRHLRSESNGHVFPTDSPGLATVEAFTTWSLRPLIQSWFDRYHPTVDRFVSHARAIARQTGFYHARVPAEIGQIERANGHWRVSDTNYQPLAAVQHLILAVGHGPLKIPVPIAQFRENNPGDDRVSLAYEPKTYASRTVLVLGDGITAATEWANILERGGAVAAISRAGFSFGQPLQVPRRYFSQRGLTSYCRATTEQRLGELQTATRGTIPAYRQWNKLFREAQQTGRLGLAHGEVIAIHDDGGQRLSCDVKLHDGGAHTITVDQVISATGFEPATAQPLLRRLIAQYQLATSADMLATDDNGCVPALSTPDSLLAVVGPAAAWTVPCADSLVGMKIVARRLANIIVGAERWSPLRLTRQTRRWAQLISGHDLV